MDLPPALHTLPGSRDTSEIAVRSIVLYIQDCEVLLLDP